MQPESLIRCGQGGADGPRRRLALDIDGEARWATLDLGALHKKLIALPDRALDLIEIAAWIYAADALMSRGGPTDHELGRRWRRRMAFVMPVRDPDFWGEAETAEALTQLVALISEDFCSFTFEPATLPQQHDALSFSAEDGFQPGSVAMFSGGLDSLAGALDEMVSRGTKLLLVSHRSATKVQNVQGILVDALKNQMGPRRLMHASVGLNVQEGATREPTHRTRSLFFAAVGAAIGQSFGIDAVHFFENGVVSLNLPPSGQVIGTRATRSTHPHALASFGALFSRVFDRSVSVDNPFMWKTKTEVVSLIRDLGGRDLIRATRSCADVRNMTKLHSHCGICSQCIDRRFAMLAAGLGEDDPEEAYEVDPLSGPRATSPDREIALGFAHNAQEFARMTPGAFLARFGEVQRATQWLGGPDDSAARRLFDLHRRREVAVTRIVKARLSAMMTDDDLPDPQSLLALLGQDRLRGQAPQIAPGAPTLAPAASRLELRVDPDRGAVRITQLGDLKGVDAKITIALAAGHLKALGARLAPEDHPFTEAKKLAHLWSVDEATLRRRFTRLRASLTTFAISRGLAPPDADAVVEKMPWHGYRLNPDRVLVVMATGAPRKAERQPKSRT
jgi:hypothetical protein